jgi:hypothetical protein
MASPSTSRRQALPDQRETEEGLCCTWRTYQTHGLRRPQVLTAVQVHQGSNLATTTSPLGSLTAPRWRLYAAWWTSVQDTASGTRIAGLMRPRLLLSAAAFTHRDQPRRLVGTHAAHGAGGVHRPQNHGPTPQQEFCRLNIAAFSLLPSAK